MPVVWTQIDVGGQAEVPAEIEIDSTGVDLDDASFGNF